LKQPARFSKLAVPYQPEFPKDIPMVQKIDWDIQIGRRLKMRDLHVFLTVVQRGSMAKAAAHMGVSQPAVSEIISDLESAVGVRLLDRSRRGVEPTMYGREMIERTRAAFDELKQGITTLESLADPTVGAVRIGCAESLFSAILAPVIERFSHQYPRVRLHVQDLLTATLDLPELRERSLDVVLARLARPNSKDEDMNVEILFNDEMVLAAGMQSRWAHRHKIDLAELVNEPWILTRPGSWNYTTMAEAFRTHGLDMPTICLTTFSVELRSDLLASGRFITAFPRSVLRANADRFSLKELPIDLPVRPWPVEIITLKNRTLSPVAQRFIEHIRAFTRSMTAGREAGN
jgi:DNA-binding transcriptional LysR family regulator